ncbi:hypothetical protein SCA6_004274 [Theobroma cacao]
MPKKLKHQNNEQDAGLKELLRIVDEPKARWILWRTQPLIPIFSRQDSHILPLLFPTLIGTFLI